MPHIGINSAYPDQYIIGTQRYVPTVSTLKVCLYITSSYNSASASIRYIYDLSPFAENYGAKGKYVTYNVLNSLTEQN